MFLFPRWTSASACNFDIGQQQQGRAEQEVMRTFTSNFDHQESFMPGQEMEAAVQRPVASVAIITPSKKTVVTNEIGSGGG